MVLPPEVTSTPAPLASFYYVAFVASSRRSGGGIIRYGSLRLPIDTPPIRESIVNIGATGAVIAIATEAAVVAGLPRVIFLNAGVLHRVGPHRLHVILARILATRGFSSLRLDLSGIGDSHPLPDALTFRESAVVDTRAAMDQVGTTEGTARFILFGLCSGAENALATARQDERVVGLVLIDPPCYATFRSYLRKAMDRIRGSASAPVTARWIVRVLSRRFSASRNEAQGARNASAVEYGRSLHALLERGVRIMCVYSGANADRYNHKDQLFERFPQLRGRMAVAHFPAANHVFTERAAREKLLDSLTGWFDEQFSRNG